MRDAAICFLLVLRRGAKPDLRPALAPIGRQHVADVPRSFREQESIERWCRADQWPQIDTPWCRHFVVKDVGHARTEDAPSRACGLRAFIPAERPAPVGRARSLAVSTYVPEIAPLAIDATRSAMRAPPHSSGRTRSRRADIRPMD